jgi:hypothetical protein
MKRMLLPIVALCAISCGKPTQQEVAEKNVQEYIKSKLEQPEAYKPVSFGIIDTVWTTIEEQNVYKDYCFAKEQLKCYNDLFNQSSLPDVRRTTLEIIKDWEEMTEQLQPSVDSLIKNFKPEIEYLTLEHIFKNIGDSGMEIENKATFRLNPVTLKVTGME